MNKPLTVRELALIRIQKPAFKIKWRPKPKVQSLKSKAQGQRIAKVLKRWRIERDITLDQAAVVTGLSRGYLHKLEQGFRGYRPSARALHRLAKLCPELKAFEQ